MRQERRTVRFRGEGHQNGTESNPDSQVQGESLVPTQCRDYCRDRRVQGRVKTPRKSRGCPTSLLVARCSQLFYGRGRLAVPSGFETRSRWDVEPIMGRSPMFCGCRIVVVLVLAKDRARVRFPSSAPSFGGRWADIRCPFYGRKSRQEFRGVSL